MRELALSYGVYASYQEKKKSVDDFINIALKDLIARHNLDQMMILLLYLQVTFREVQGFHLLK